MDMRIIRILAVVLAFSALANAQDDVLARARAAVKAGKQAAALSLLEENYTALKGNLEALVLLADLSLKAGQTGKAMDYALGALKLDETHVEANLAAGRAFYNRGLEAIAEGRSTGGQIQGMFEEAEQFLAAALARDPKRADIWALKADCLYRSGGSENLTQAAQDYQKALAINPRNVPWQLAAARAHKAAGNIPAALESLSKALKLNPASSELLMLQGDMYGMSQPPQLEQAVLSYKACLEAKDLSLERGGQVASRVWNILGRNKKLEDGLALMRAWTQAHKDAYTAWWWAGYHEFQLARYDDSIKDYGKAFEVSGRRHANSAIAAGDCFARKGDLETAAQWMVKASKAEWQDQPMSPAARITGLVGTYFRKGQLKQAVAFLEKYGLAVGKDDWRILNNLGFAYRDLSTAGGSRSRTKKLSEKSAAYYERACKSVLADARATPTQKAQTLNDCGILYSFPRHRINKIAHAVEYYRKALSLDPNYTDAIENLGLCFNTLGKYEEAAALFQKVLAKQPGRMVSRNGLKTAQEGLKK